MSERNFDLDMVLLNLGVSKPDFDKARNLLAPMLEQMDEVVDYTPDYPAPCRIRELKYRPPNQPKSRPLASRDGLTLMYRAMERSLANHTDFTRYKRLNLIAACCRAHDRNETRPAYDMIRRRIESLEKWFREQGADL